MRSESGSRGRGRRERVGSVREREGMYAESKREWEGGGVYGGVRGFNAASNPTLTIY